MDESRPFPDPGILPTLPAPKPGEKISIRVAGYPPYKEIRASIRNPHHPRYSRFVSLRREAAEQMAGRAWTDGAVRLSVTIYAPEFEAKITLNDYAGGILDTLDGSHGYTFTYLPIVFQDDCQVTELEERFRVSEEVYYVVKVEFLMSA